MEIICKGFFGIALTILLVACATQPPVKDVLADPEAHLTANFTEAKLSDSVRNALGVKTPGKVVRRVQLKMVMTIAGGDKTQSFEKVNTYFVLDNGLVRGMVQSGSNGIFSITEFDLSYHDIFNLIYQSTLHNANTLFPPTFTKVIAKLDNGIADPKESTEYAFEYALVPEVQIMNFKNQKTVCKTGKWVSAATVHSKLTGMGLPIDCEYFGTNGQTFLKMQSMFIKDLGITIKRESVTSTTKRTWTVGDVSVTRP